MRTINLPTTETAKEYLARVQAEKRAEALHKRALMKSKEREALTYIAFAGGVMVIGLLLYAVFCPTM